jgi:Arc/MetJ-type ribon-helix-helix transcriptional regulator
MRTSKSISISLPPAQLREALRLAKRENRTMSELIREALRRYQQPQTPAATPVSEWATALARLRADAEAKGTTRLSNRAINREIAAVRKRARRNG